MEKYGFHRLCRWAAAKLLEIEINIAAQFRKIKRYCWWLIFFLSPLVPHFLIGGMVGA
jgi:hypothetical protein